MPDVDQRTAIQRITTELHKENPEDETLALISLVKTHDYYAPQRFYFNETTWEGNLVEDQYIYPRGVHWQFMERPDSIWLRQSNRWDKLWMVPSQEWMAWNRPDQHAQKPLRWTWYQDSIWFDPVPDQEYEVRILYVKNTDIMEMQYDGTKWNFYRNGQIWGPTDTSQMLVHAPELAIARTKWDLYFNVYDDEENAQKMQLLVDLEMSRLNKRLNNYRQELMRQPVTL